VTSWATGRTGRCRPDLTNTRCGIEVRRSCGLPSLGLSDVSRTVRSPGCRSVSDAKWDGGVLVHEVTSPYQAGTTRIRLLVRTSREGQEYRVAVRPPVEAGVESRSGRAEEIKSFDLHNKFGPCSWPRRFSTCRGTPTTRPSPMSARSPIPEGGRPVRRETYPVKTEPSGRLLLGSGSPGGGRSRSCCGTRTCLAGGGVGHAAGDGPARQVRERGHLCTQDNFDRYTHQLGCSQTRLTCSRRESG